MPNVHLLLGSNLGRRAELLSAARELIEQRIGAIVRMSEQLQTEPWGYESSNLYLNQVIVVDTRLEPLCLLDLTQQIERDLGRVPRKGELYEDRPIDIDILYYDDLHINTPRLTIPHPQIGNREFVLQLLDNIKP